MPSDNSHSDTILEISLGNIARNYKIIQKRAKNSEAAAVVKANAYGLGVAEVAEALAAAGCKKFFVATLDEALELRKILRSQRIYVFHGIRKNQTHFFSKNKITPVLNDPGEIRMWKRHSNLPVVIHVNTGMNRLGLSHDQLDQDFGKLKVEYVMSHMACADEPESNMNKEQLKNFNSARRHFPSAKYSLANSASIFLADCYHFDLVRPGSALYGINPSPGRNPMHNVVSLKSQIIQLRTLSKMESVGYGATARLPKGSKVAVIPLGYADGYLRSLSNSGICYIDGARAPVVGRVSMDLSIIDVTAIPESKLRVGKGVEIIGKNATVDDVAKEAGTIGYEILTRLGSRFRRIYV